MTDKSVVSIIVPVYNVSTFLSGCLESILAQTFTDYEVICIDDGSTDNSGEIADSYAAKDSRIKVVHQENKGLSGARNAGLDLAVGDYISFLDSDDYIHPQFLEKMLYVIQHENADIASCRLVHTKETYMPIQSMFDESLLKVTICHQPFDSFLNSKEIMSNVCVKFYKRDLIGDLRFIDGVYFEDVPFTTMIMDKAQKVAITNMPFYFYYQNPASIMRSSFTIRKVQSYITIIRKIASYIRKNRPDSCKQVRIKILNKRIKMMINQAIRKQKDKKERLKLFDEIQKHVKILFNEGLISYEGLKPRHKIALYLLLHTQTGKAACFWMTIF